MRTRAGAAALVVAVLATGLGQVSRPGYSPDEEFTLFAVRGIAASPQRLPLLPSGLLYDRGLGYSFASWVVGRVSRAELPAYRALSLLSAAGILLLVAQSRSSFGLSAASMALLLIATSTPFWVVATTGRFYAPFLAVFIATVLALRTPGTAGTLGALVALSFVARLLHELAFILPVIPAVLFAVSPKGRRSRWLLPAAAMASGLAVAQFLIFAAHAVAPDSGETMIRRFFVWQVLNLFEVPPDRQFGIPFVVLAIAWLIAPRRARLNTVVALCFVAFIVSLSLSRALTAAPFSWALVQGVLVEGSRYPLDMFWHIVRTTPLTIALALGLLLARLAGMGGEWRPIERAAHLLWIGWVVWFGVIESGITTNYLLLPMSFMVIAIAIDLAAIISHRIDQARRAGQMASLAVCILVVAAVASDQWRGTSGSFASRLEQVRPTIDVDGIEEIKESLQPGDRVACTDELGCLMLVGRIDAWLALDDYVRERFVVRKENGQRVGVYTGKPAVNRPLDLFDGPAAERIIVVDVFKEFPIGNSRGWLPRALQRDGLDGTVLLETPQVRIVEISRPLQHARQFRQQP